jgi:hypothetical protein
MGDLKGVSGVCSTPEEVTTLHMNVPDSARYQLSLLLAKEQFSMLPSQVLENVLAKVEVPFPALYMLMTSATV